jgi:hypothetical protein
MKNSFKLLALATMLTTAGVMLAGTNDDDATLNQISGYRQWTRVNREPIQVKAVSVEPKAITAGEMAV